MCVGIAACAAPAPAPAQTSQPPPATLGPTPPPAASAAPRGGGALVEAALGSLAKTLHPYPDSASYTQAWIDAAALIWGAADGGGALLAFDWDALDYRPAMAARLPQVSADGKTFTFTLRDDLKWSDGSPLGAEDFQFAYDQASREENAYVQLNLVQEIATYRTPDPRTIQVTLKEPRALPVAYGVVNVITPVPRKVWSGRSWTDASANPEILGPSVVLGPFAVQEFRSAERAVFVPVDSFYAGKPRVPRVEILASQGPSDAVEALKAGRANWVRALPPDEYQAASATPSLSVKEWTAANAAYRSLEFNLTRSFLSDRRVRQALAYAVDRSELLSGAEQGLGVPQYSFVQPTNTRWVNTAVDKYDVALDKARQLLHDAGYQLTNGRLIGRDGQPVKVQVVYPTSSAPRARIAAYLQRHYAQLGVGVDIKGLDFNAYTDQVLSRHDFDIALATYGGGSIDPELGARAQLMTSGPQNVTGYTNPRVDELFRQAASELDASRRKQLYDQVQMLVNADVPSHYLYALTSVDVFASSVHGVTTHQADRLDANSALLSWSVDP